MISFSDDQIDLLTELVNIGVGRAASSLSDMVAMKVTLDVPSVELVEKEKISTCLNGDLSEISCIEQQFQGRFSGRTVLVFPYDVSCILVQLLMGEDFVGDHDEHEQVLLEVGNVVINGLMGSLGNIVQSPLQYEVPAYDRGSTDTMQKRWSVIADGSLLAQVSFDIAEAELTGQVLVMFEIGSLQELSTALNDMLGVS